MSLLSSALCQHTLTPSVHYPRRGQMRIPTISIIQPSHSMCFASNWKLPPFPPRLRQRCEVKRIIRSGEPVRHGIAHPYPTKCQTRAHRCYVIKFIAFSVRIYRVHQRTAGSLVINRYPALQTKKDSHNVYINNTKLLRNYIRYLQIRSKNW